MRCCGGYNGVFGVAVASVFSQTLFASAFSMLQTNTRRTLSVRKVVVLPHAGYRYDVELTQKNQKVCQGFTSGETSNLHFPRLVRHFEQSRLTL